MKKNYIFAALSALVITMAGCSSGGQTDAWGAFKNGGGSGDVPVSETSKQLTYFAISPTGSVFMAGTIDEATHTVTFPVAMPPMVYYIQYSSTGKYTQLAGAGSPLVSGVSTVDFITSSSIVLNVFDVNGDSQPYTVTVTTTGTATGSITGLYLQYMTGNPIALSPAFSSAIFSGYEAFVASDVANIKVVLTTPTIDLCSMTVNGAAAPAFSGSTSVAALVAGNNTIVVMCGSAAYTITVTRGTTVAPVIKDFKLLSALNSDEMLTTDCFGSIDESAEPGTIDVWVPAGTMLGALIPTFSVSAGYVTDGATTQQSGITSRNFYSGEVLYIVTDGSVTRSYNVLVTDVGLDNLTVDGTTVVSFSEAKRAYTASVQNGTTSITVGWTKKVISDAVSVINNSTANTFNDQNPTLNTSSVVVTLLDGYSTDKITVPVERPGRPTKTYSITVTRY